MARTNTTNGGGGGGGITSINGDNAAAQLLLDGYGLDVTDLGGGQHQFDAIYSTRNNVDTVAPGVNDDFNSDYRVGSRWFDKTAGILYVCTNASPGAAVWQVASQVQADYAEQNNLLPSFIQNLYNAANGAADGSNVLTNTLPHQNWVYVNDGTNDINTMVGFDHLEYDTVFLLTSPTMIGGKVKINGGNIADSFLLTNGAASITLDASTRDWAAFRWDFGNSQWQQVAGKAINSKYALEHNATSDWANVPAGFWSIGILATAHQKGLYPSAQFFEGDKTINGTDVSTPLTNGEAFTSVNGVTGFVGTDTGTVLTVTGTNKLIKSGDVITGTSSGLQFTVTADEGLIQITPNQNAIAPNGDLTFNVTDTPDLRYPGKVVIS